MSLKHGDRVALAYDTDKFCTLFCTEDHRYYIKIDFNAPHQGWPKNIADNRMLPDTPNTWWAVTLRDIIKIGPSSFKSILMSKFI